MATMNTKLKQSAPATAAIAAALALSPTPLFAQSATAGSVQQPQSTAQPADSPSLSDIQLADPAATPSTAQTAPSMETISQPAPQIIVPETTQAQAPAADPIVVPEVTPQAVEASPAPTPAAKPTGTARTGEPVARTSTPTPSPAPAATTASAPLASDDVSMPGDAAGFAGDDLLTGDTEAAPVAPASVPETTGNADTGGSDLMFIAGAGAAGLALVALLLLLASRRRKAAGEERVVETTEMPLRRTKREAEMPVEPAPRIRKPEPEAPEAVAAAISSASAAVANRGKRDGLVNVRDPRMPRGPVVKRSVTFGDMPVSERVAKAATRQPAAEPRPAWKVDPVAEREVHGDTATLERPVREEPVTEAPMAKSPMAEAAMPEAPVVQSPVVETPAAEPTPAPVSGNVVAQAKTSEGRSDLLDRLTAAQPDEANPFHSPRARRRRARLILQTLMQRMKENPNLDFGRFYRGFALNHGGGDPAFA